MNISSISPETGLRGQRVVHGLRHVVRQVVDRLRAQGPHRRLAEARRLAGAVVVVVVFVVVVVVVVIVVVVVAVAAVVAVVVYDYVYDYVYVNVLRNCNLLSQLFC